MQGRESIGVKIDGIHGAVSAASDLLAALETPASAVNASVSGLYLWQPPVLLSSPIPQATDLAPMPGDELEVAAPGVSEELRLDVDGRYPQMVASGVIHGGITSRVHWIANLAASGADTWTGTIFYKDGNPIFLPYDSVKIQIVRNAFPSQRKAKVSFYGNGASQRARTFKFKAPYFHSVDFEFDFVQGQPALLQINTIAHPDRPATLPAENLTIQSVFERAGFNATTSPGDPIPLVGAGANATWSDQEMHDAMQAYWAHFDSSSQWAMWVFFAALHDMGRSLGGIMFDDIGPNHRQGTAIFNDSFIKNPPANDPSPAAWVERMNFWTTCHEMGHCFNLAHSWQKALGSSWIPLVNDPEARSFMNYPYSVAGGQAAFFRNFEFRFGDGELLFMRHAPERFVQMGNAEWFDNHGFQEANVSLEPKFRLELRANRESPIFEFLEPAMLELKLTNISNEPQLISEKILSTFERMTVIIKKKDKPARQFAPFAQYCWQPKNKVLNPEESIYESLFVAAGRNGWEIAEPGYYLVQVAIDLGDEDLVSNPLTLRVAPPTRYEEEFLAQDFFSDDVARILTFDGSRYLNKGNDILHEVANQLSDRRAAIHARVPLAMAMAREYKYLDLNGGKNKYLDLNGSKMAATQAARKCKVKVEAAEVKEARKEFDRALNTQHDEAAETLGHIDYKYYTDNFAEWLDERGDKQESAKVRESMYDTLSARGVLDRVLGEVKPGAETKRSKAGAEKGQTPARKTRPPQKKAAARKR